MQWLNGLLAFSVAVAGLGGVQAGQTTDEQLKKDLEFAATWIYDDMNAGFAESKKSGKPLLITFRCVP